MFKFIKRLKNEKGMSLIEIMIVLGIIAAASAAIFSSVFTGADKAKSKQAEAEINKLAGFVKVHKQDTGKYPTTDEGFQALVDAGFIEELPLDPWKTAYTYESPGSNGQKFTICSAGPNEESEDDNICNFKKAE
ncbi:MAG: type II secretion system protein GspG [Deltaproteobacteria bacterium]|nr:type II secretion system protein GspG [Deltaproteobacteria bacterium]